MALIWCDATEYLQVVFEEIERASSLSDFFWLDQTERTRTLNGGNLHTLKHKAISMNTQTLEKW